MRIIGIDYGSKRVGVAVSDESGKFALPVSVIANSPLLQAEVSKVADQYGVKEIVLGESRDYKGLPNKILNASMDFKAAMEKEGFTVHWEPEFMTSMHVERLQGKSDMTDASAAAVILQSFLDRRAAENE